MNTTSLTKLHHQMVAVTEERDRLAAELAKMMEQGPVAWLIPQSALVTFDEDWAHENPDYCDPLFLAPVAAPAVPAPSVPTDEQIHTAYRVALGQSIRERDMPEIRKFAIALLQSIEVKSD